MTAAKISIGLILIAAGVACLAGAALLRQRWRRAEEYDYNSRNICIGVVSLGVASFVLGMKLLASA